MLCGRERLILNEAHPALKRNANGGAFERAKAIGPRPPTFATWRVNRLVDAGLLRWVNRCRSAATLTEDGERER
jgi:hypothetical protein